MRHKDIQSKISKLVNVAEELNKLRGTSGFVTKKRGVVLLRNNYTPEKVSGEYTASGKFYPLVPGKRSVFRRVPMMVASEQYYLELKGYGKNGRDMYFQEHVSGDVFYGMYLNLAIQEFERTTRAINLELPVSLPLAVVEIPREEYLKKGIVGFQQTLSALISLRFVDSAKIARLIGGVDTLNEDTTAKKLIRYAVDKNDGNLEKAVDFLIVELNSGTKLGIDGKADALISGKRVGYYIRASKCPIRVGDPSDKDIGTPEFHKIANQMGYTFRVLLENGILHHCPGTGNWTIAGELTDFADSFDLETQQADLKNHMIKLKKENILNFIKYLIGPEHTGVLCESFIEGIYGKKLSLDQVASRLAKLF